MKVLWYEPSSDSVVPFNRETHGMRACMFLFWSSTRKDTMLVGPNIQAGTYHKHLHAVARAVQGDLPSMTPKAAGECLAGIITSWISIDQKVLTPEEYRGPIADALGFTISPEPEVTLS